MRTKAISRRNLLLAAAALPLVRFAKPPEQEIISIAAEHAMDMEKAIMFGRRCDNQKIAIVSQQVATILDELIRSDYQKFPHSIDVLRGIDFEDYDSIG